MTMNYGVGWKIWIFHFQQKMLCYDFFFGEKAPRSSSWFRFWTHLLLLKVTKNMP